MAFRKTTTAALAGMALVASLSACGPLAWSAAHHGGPARPRATPAGPVVKPTTPPATRPTTGAPTTAPTTTAPTTSAPVTTAPTTSATDAYEARILVLVNNERTSRGLSPLTASTCADGFAESWAPVLQRNGGLSHQSLSPILSTCHSRTAGENVAYGNVSADQMMTMWMNSSGHRANILSPNYTAIGIGAVTDASGRWYGVQDFTG